MSLITVRLLARCRTTGLVQLGPPRGKWHGAVPANTAARGCRPSASTEQQRQRHREAAGASGGGQSSGLLSPPVVSVRAAQVTSSLSSAGRPQRTDPGGPSMRHDDCRRSATRRRVRRRRCHVRERTVDPATPNRDCDGYTRIGCPVRQPQPPAGGRRSSAPAVNAQLRDRPAQQPAKDIRQAPAAAGVRASAGDVDPRRRRELRSGGRGHCFILYWPVVPVPARPCLRRRAQSAASVSPPPGTVPDLRQWAVTRIDVPLSGSPPRGPPPTPGRIGPGCP